MANKKMAAQSSGSLQTCDWVGGGEGGKFVAPRIQRQYCGAMSSLALNVSPWNMVGLLILNRALMNSGSLVFIK